MKLYDAMTPNTLRVNVFLAEKGIDLPREKIDVLGGGTRTPEFLAINSKGEVPVLELDDGTRIAESIAICRYIEALHPTPSLFGETPRQQALIEMWNRRVELHLFNAIGNMAQHSFPFFADKIEQFADYSASQWRRFEEVWGWLDSELSDGRTYLVGDRFSVADITGMAALLICDIAEKTTPRDARHARRWEDALRARPSFVERMPNAA